MEACLNICSLKLGAELGRFLDLDGAMGHKILRGERKLTVEHGKKLAAEFHLSPSYFIASVGIGPRTSFLPQS